MNYTPPRPSSLDPNWNPHGGKPDPIRKGKKPRPTIPDRKLKPKNTSPGFRSTDKTEVITALTSIAERNWGELICYPVQNVGTVRYVYETVAETTGVSDGIASKSLSEWLALQIIPGDSAEKDAAKQELGYFNIAVLAMPGRLKGLSGGISLKAGSRGILAIAKTMSARSSNAYIGFEPELYVEVIPQPIEPGSSHIFFEEIPIYSFYII